MMRKIAFIAANEYVPWGGSEYLWAGAAERLARCGVEVHVSVKDWREPIRQIEQLRAAGCQIFKRPTPGLARRALRKLPPWREYVHRHVKKVGAGADLVIVSQGSNTDGLPWMEALLATGYKYGVIVQGAAEMNWPPDNVIERFAQAYEGASRVYFVSEASLALTRRQFVAPLSRGCVIRNPFNVRYDARPPWPSNGSVQLSLAFVSRLETMGKGHDMLLEVLALSRWRERNIHVSLYGDGPNERSLHRMVEQAKLTSIRFAGFSESIEQIWSNHQVLIFPSRHEGMPLALVEAMLCGRPAIATDVGGVRELVRDGINGFLAKAPTVELLDEAMNRAWENRHRLKEMGEQAAADVHQWVSADPVEDFVRELTALVESR